MFGEKNMKKKIAIVGIGYVGINLACAFSKKFEVIGYDINFNKIEKMKNGIDVTNQIKDKLSNYNILFTNDESKLKLADVIIITVPTPIDSNNNPDLYCLESATKTVAKNMKKGVLIIYESTVAPGTTQKTCKTLLEKYSNKKCEKDFLLGYSPERINPGDNINTIYNSTKIISATNLSTLNKMKKIYGSIIDKLYVVESIEIAEATKLIENTQRDVNIAFMNQITQYLTVLNIPRKDVFDAMKSKWNALNYNPGLVGGHCISVDPYYLIDNGNENKIDLSLLKEARKINNSVSDNIANNVSKFLKKGNKIGILGFSYKKDSNDIRNTKVYEVSKKLMKKGFYVEIADYNLDSENILKEYDINFVNKISDVDLLILAVPHSKYITLKPCKYKKMFKNNSTNIIYDVYNVLDLKEFKKSKIKIERM